MTEWFFSDRRMLRPSDPRTFKPSCSIWRLKSVHVTTKSPLPAKKMMMLNSATLASPIEIVPSELKLLPSPSTSASSSNKTVSLTRNWRSLFRLTSKSGWTLTVATVLRPSSVTASMSFRSHTLSSRDPHPSDALLDLASAERLRLYIHERIITSWNRGLNWLILRRLYYDAFINHISSSL